MVRAGATNLYRFCTSVLLPVGCVSGGPAGAARPPEAEEEVEVFAVGGVVVGVVVGGGRRRWKCKSRAGARKREQMTRTCVVVQVLLGALVQRPRSTPGSPADVAARGVEGCARQLAVSRAARAAWLAAERF